MNGLTRFPLSLSPIPNFSFSLLFFSLPGAILVSLSLLQRVQPPERLPELLSVSPWEMALEPAPPPVVLAIPAPSLSPNLSSLSPYSDPYPSTSVLSSSPSDPACPSPVLAPPPLSSPASSPASPAPASQQQCEDQDRHKLPADLLCFLSFLPPSRSVESPPDQRFSAMPEPPPAAPTISEAPSSTFPQLPNSSPRRHHPADVSVSAQPAVLIQCPPPVRCNASAPSFAVPSTALPPESAAPFPLLSSSPPKLPQHADVPLPGQPSELQHRPLPVRRNAQANPVHHKSYAQAAKGTPGPGFVRAHAREVASFARLPRTGLNVICGSHEGMPACSIVSSDLPKVEGLYAKALVMKFHGGRPSLAASHKEFSSWGFESSFSIGPLSSKSYLLRFQEERDLLKILTRPSSTLLTFPYKVFRWHNRLHIKEESCLVPIWITLPRLPTQCFAPEFLESLASLIGRFLCLDKATATLARPSEARMCIEIDLRKERPQFIWIGLFEGFKQPIVYERVPKFCSGCLVQGHTNVECSKSSLDTLQSHISGPNPTVQECLQPVRRNDKELLSTVSPRLNTQSATTPLPLDVAPPHKPKASAATPLLPLENSLQSPASPIAASAVLFPELDPQQATHDHTHQQLPPSTISPAVFSSEQQLYGPDSSAQQPLPPYQPPSLPGSVANSLDLHSPIPPLQQAGVSSVLAVQQSDVSGVLAVQQSGVSGELQPPCPHSSNKLSPSPRHKFPAIRLMPQPRSSPVRSNAAEASPAAAPPLHQSQPQHPPPPSTKNRSKHNKSVSFMPEQSNIQANQVVWDVVNRQIEQFNKAQFSSNERAPEYSHYYKEPPDPSFFTHFESDSEASVEAHSPTGSQSTIAHEEGSSFPQSYASEGEELNVEPINLQGHISDDAFYQRPKSSKRNKRLPDGPLKVKLRARKGSSSIHR